MLLLPLPALILAGLIVITLQTSLFLGLGSVVALYLIDTAFGGLPPIELGVNLFAADVVFSMLSVAGVVRFVTKRNGFPSLIWVVFGFSVFISLIVGAYQFGTTAFVDAREHFYFWSCVFYLMSFTASTHDLERLFRGTVLSAGLLCLIVLFRWVSDAIGIGDYTIYGAGVAYRVAPATAAYFIGMAVLVTLVSRPVRFSGLVALIFLGVIVILQHRSVWLAIGVALLALPLMSAYDAKRTLSYYGVIGILAIIIATALTEFSSGESIVESILKSFASGTNLEEGTTYDRIELWKSLLSHWWNGGFATWMLGIPYGTDYETYVRIEGGFRLLDFSAHNFYVQTIYNNGAVGLAAWCVVYVMAVEFTWRNRGNRASGRVSSTLFVLLVSGLVFFVGYQANYLHGIALGLAIGMMRNKVIAKRQAVVSERKLPIAPYQA